MTGYFESNDYKKRINELLDVTLGSVRATKTSTRRIRDCCRLCAAPALLHAWARVASPCLVIVIPNHQMNRTMDPSLKHNKFIFLFVFTIFLNMNLSIT